MNAPDYQDAPESYDDLSEKDLLVFILAELQAIRHRLPAPDRGDGVRYECVTCGAEVGADARETHLVDVHNAPQGLDPSEEYREVEVAKR